MEYNKFIDLSRTYLYCQLKISKEKKPVEGITERVHPFVTISREAGAGGSTLTSGLVDYLSADDINSDCPWTLFDKDLAGRVSDDIRLKGIENILPEEKFSDIQTMFEELFGVHPTKREMAHNINRAILKLAGMGDIVIVGRGGFYITRHLKHGLHVRLIGSLAGRTKHMVNAYGLSIKEAESYVKKEDVKRYDYIKKLFGVDINDPHNYDLLINTDHIPIPEAIELIGTHVFRLRENNHK